MFGIISDRGSAAQARGHTRNTPRVAIEIWGLADVVQLEAKRLPRDMVAQTVWHQFPYRSANG